MKLKFTGKAKNTLVYQRIDEDGPRKEARTFNHGDELEIDDKSGHQVMASYDGLFEVVEYGKAAKQKPEPEVGVRSRQAKAPRTKVVPPAQ